MKKYLIYSLLLCGCDNSGDYQKNQHVQYNNYLEQNKTTRIDCTVKQNNVSFKLDGISIFGGNLDLLDITENNPLIKDISVQGDFPRSKHYIIELGTRKSFRLSLMDSEIIIQKLNEISIQYKNIKQELE